MRRPSEIVSMPSVYLGELCDRLGDLPDEEPILKTSARIIGSLSAGLASMVIDALLVMPLWKAEDQILGKKIFEERYMVQKNHYDGGFHGTFFSY